MGNSSSHKTLLFTFIAPHSFLYAISERECTFIISWSLLPRYYFQNLCNSVSQLPSDLLRLFIYINAFTLPQIFYLKWDKPALHLPFCFQPLALLGISFPAGSLELMSAAAFCLLLPAQAGPCLPRALACTLLVFLEILSQEFSLSFPKISFFCSSSYPEQQKPLHPAV